MKSARLRCKRFSVAIKGILFFEKMLVKVDMVMHFYRTNAFVLSPVEQTLAVHDWLGKKWRMESLVLYFQTWHYVLNETVVVLFQLLKWWSGSLWSNNFFNQRSAMWPFYRMKLLTFWHLIILVSKSGRNPRRKRRLKCSSCYKPLRVPESSCYNSFL